jgi:pyruvate kinase
MDVARINFSHGARGEHRERIRALRDVAERTGRPVAILQDLAGPKIRIGAIAGGSATLEKGADFTLTTRSVPGDARSVTVTYGDLPADVRPGDKIFLADGALELEVVETTGEEVRCRVVVGGVLTSRKGINLPTRSVRVPMFTEKDREDLAFGIEEGVDLVALSFVRDPEEVRGVRRFLEERGAAIPLLAKIEKHEALARFEEILDVVDGVLVARGDLGVETPLEAVPRVQKSLIHRSNRSGKPVITATQMLRSMVESPRPTRAEATDVANAVLDGTDAVMLSEETAIGRFPVEAVETMRRIVEDAEEGFPFDLWEQRLGDTGAHSTAEAVSLAACRLAQDLEAAAIVAFTQSGSTARLLSKHRPRAPILAATPLEETYRRLALVWGVVPLRTGSWRTRAEMTRAAVEAAKGTGRVRAGDRVVVIAGAPVGVPGTTNLIEVQTAP